MDKSIKIILFLIIGIVIVSAAATLFNNSNIRDMRADLKNAKANTDAAINELRNSQMKLDSIKADMRNFSAYISNIHKAVEIDEYNKQLDDEDNTKKQKILEKKIDSLEQERQKEAVNLQPIGVRR